MKSKKIVKILKKSLVLFICIWLFITQMPINNVFAEETNEEPPVTEIDNQEEQEPQEIPEEQENGEEAEEDNQEIESEQEPILLNESEPNETYVVELYNGETFVNEAESFAVAVDAVNNGDADKIALLANISISESYIFINDVTIDLSGKKIIVAQKNENITFKGSFSSITNGTIAVSELGTSAIKAAIVVDDNANLQIGRDAIIKSRIAFQLNNNAELYITDNAEINARNLIDTSFSNSILFIKDQAKLHLVGDLTELTGFGYWRTSASAFNGTIAITGGLFTNNQYPTYEGYTITSKLKDYYGQETFSDIELDDETYKYQVIKGGGITFDVQGGIWDEDYDVHYYYEYEKGLVLPTSENISRAGYTFIGWFLDDELVIEIPAETMGNINVIASWTANTNTQYVVKHIYEMESGGFPTEEGDYLNVIYYTGTTDTEVTPDFILKPGYSSPNKLTKKIAGDGSTVFEYYYRLGVSELAIYSNDDNKGTVAIEGYTRTIEAIADKTEVTIVAAPAPGYEFIKWVDTYNEATIINTNASYKFTMGNSSISYTAIFEPDRDNEVWGIKVKTTDVTQPVTLCYEDNGYYFYQNIADAVEFARNGAEVEIIKDVIVSESAPIERTITINLNEQKIEQLLNDDLYFVNKQMFMITSSGNLTLKGKGEIISAVSDEYGYDKRSIIYNDGGILTLNDDISLTTTGRNVVAVRNDSGTVYINDANITSNIVAIAIHSGGIEINDGAIIKNTSKLKEKNYYYSSDYRQALIFFEYSNEEARININGGELTSTVETMFDSDYSWNCYVDVKGGVLNPSDSGYISNDRGLSIEFNGGTVNSNNYLFADYGGVIHSGFFNIKNGISSKKDSYSVMGGKYHVYYHDPSKINALYIGYSVTENEYYNSVTEPYEYRVLSKSTISFNTGFNIYIDPIQTYKTRTVEDGLMPQNPTHIGYSFEGWYFDTGYTQKFNKDEFIFTNDYYTLYAKWTLNPNDPVWACRLKTVRIIGSDDLRKYVEGDDTYYYYMINENSEYESYSDFIQAFKDAKYGETIELLKNVTLKEYYNNNRYYAYSTISGFTDDNITLDLKGYTLKAEKKYDPIFDFSYSECENFTIKNGTVYYDTSTLSNSSFFKTWNIPVTVNSYDVKYLSNCTVPEDKSYYKLFLINEDVSIKIYGGYVGENICLMESYYESNETFEVVNGYDFRFTGKDFNTSDEEEDIERVLLKGGIYVYNPDLYAAYGYVSKENKQTITEDEEEIEYNYEIVPGYKVHFIFNDKKTDPVRVNVLANVGKVSSSQVPVTPEWPGYKFIGWYTQKEGGEKIEDVTTVDINDDKTYYAHWSRDIFEVSFDLDGGYVEVEDDDPLTEISPISVEYKNKYPDLPTPKKDGFYFLGWYADDEYDEESAPLIEKDSDVLITHAHTLYAHWTTKTVTVLFDCNGGCCNSIVSGDEPEGDSYSLFTIVVNYNSTYGAKLVELPSPTRDGYEFDGWYTQKVGGDKIEKNTLYVDYPTEKLYAHWTSETKTITLYYLYKFDLNYYSGDSQKRSDTKNITVTYGNTYGDALLDPTIHTLFSSESASFIGWNTSMDGYGEFITKDDVVEYDYLEALYAIYDYPSSFNKTIYFDYGYDMSDLSSSVQGQGLREIYSFWFDLENGVIPETISDDISLPQPQKEGYTFDGWKIDGTTISNNTTLSSIFTNGSTHKTAVAQWSNDTQEKTVSLVDFYKYNIDYYSEAGHSLNDDYPITVTCGNAYGDSLIDPTIHNDFSYVKFIGWNTKYDGRGIYITSDTVFNPDDFVLSGNSEYFLYAIYGESDNSNYRTILFDYGYNAGSSSYLNRLEYDIAYATEVSDSNGGNSLPQPQREGYTFDGWKIDSLLINNDTLLTEIFNDSRYKVAVAQWSYDTKAIKLYDFYKYDIDYYSESDHYRYDTYDFDVTCGSAYGNLLISPTIHTDYESIEFIGWNTKMNGSGKYITSSTIFNPDDFNLGGTSEYYLYAIYDLPEEYYKTIQFVYGCEQDNLSSTPFKFTYKYNFGDETVTVPKKITDCLNDGSVGTSSLPEPQRLGYEFIGWKIDGIIIDDDTLLSDIFTNGSIYKKAIAQWQLIGNGINSTFFANGGMFGTGDSASNITEIKQTINSAYVLPTSNPTREGYEFVGWYLVEGECYAFTESNYSVQNIKDIITSQSIVKEENCCSKVLHDAFLKENEILIFAIWKPSTIEYTINHMFVNPYYDDNNGSYYEGQYSLVDSDTYEIDNNSFVTVYPKEYEGMANDTWGGTFAIGSPIRINERHVAYSIDEYNPSYDSTKPYNIYYYPNSYTVIVDWNYDGNLKYEADKTYEYTTYDKYYRDVFTINQYGRDSVLYNVLKNEYETGRITNPGYSFSKWIDDDGNPIVFYDFSKEKTEQPTPTTMPSENFIVHAVWTANTYTIKYDEGTYSDPDIEIQGEMEDQTVTIGTEDDRLNKNEFTREGYDFIGWTKEQPIGGYPSESFDFSDEQIIESGSGSIEELLIQSQDGCITLYPVWKAKEYNVTFHVNGGVASDSMHEQIVIEDDCISAIGTYDDYLYLYRNNEIVKDRYIFSGWYIDLDGDYPANGSDNEKDIWYEEHSDEDYYLGGDTDSSMEPIYTYPRDVDLYLRWKPEEYNFNFYLFCQKNDATFDDESVQDLWDQQFLTVKEKFNEKIELPKFKINTEYGDETVRPGYDFVGWYIYYQDPVTKTDIKKVLTEDDVLDLEFCETYLGDDTWVEQYYVYPEWKQRKDVKYKINIYQQEIDGNYWDGSDPVFSEDPIATYEMTGSPWKQVDITSMLSHKKYQFKGFELRDDYDHYEKTTSGRYNTEYDYYDEMNGNSITPDGSTVFNVYYLRNVHEIYAFRKRSDMVKDQWDSWQNAINGEYPYQYDQEITDSDWQYFINCINEGSDFENEFNSFVVMSPVSIQDIPTKMPDEDLLVVATYEGDEFDITFDANGGEFKGGFETCKEEQYYDTLFRVPEETPYRENYAFDGWYLEDGTKIERTENYFVSFRGERTAYAHWTKPMVEVTTVDPNNEELSSTVIYSNLINAAKDINKDYYKNVTIKLLIDSTVHDSVNLSCENITIDLNGHTLFFESNNGENFITFNESKVTITDTTIDELGKLVSTGSSTVVVNNSIFTMDAGTLENQGTDSNGCVLYINNDYPEYTINILGGSIIYTNNAGDYVIENPTCIYNKNSSYITIGSDSSKDGTIVLSIPDTSNGYIIHNLKNVTINGGAFIAPNGTLGNLVVDESASDDDEGEDDEEDEKAEKPASASDETVINSGFFELKNPIEVAYTGDVEIYKKEIFKGGFFNIENIDLINNYISEDKVIVNSFGSYFGNNSYLYFYEIGEKESTIVHFVVTDPITHEQVGEAVTKDDVSTGDKISDLEGTPTPSDTDTYYFEGWTTSPDGNNNVTIISNPFEHTLYSLWAKATRNLVFTIADKSKDIVDPQDLDPAEEAIPFSTINIKGTYPELPSGEYVNSIGRKQNSKYKFGGWYTSTNKRVNKGDQFVINGIIDESDIELHAKWIEADVYLVKMNSVLEGSDTVKSIANLMCSNNVVYEDTDGNGLKAINEDKNKYNFLYWKINDYVVKYDRTGYKWNIIENYGESNETVIETINVGEEEDDEVLESKYIELNFDLFAREGSRDIDVYAVYEYIGEHKSLLRVEGHKSFKVEIESEKSTLFGLLSETEKLTYDAVLDSETQLYTVEVLVDIGSTVRTIYDNDANKDFSSWVKSSNIILSNKPTFEFSIAVDTIIKLVTKSDNGELDEGSYYVEFRNNSGLLINSAVVTENTLNEVINNTMIPSLTGWTFRYWSLDYEHEVNFEAIEKAAGDNKNTVTLRPIYKLSSDVQKTTVYIYTVVGGQASENKVLNDQQVGSSFYINAPKLEGKTFSYWANENDIILGYTNTYALTLVDCVDYKYYAHYDEEEIIAKPIITLNGLVKVTDVVGEMESQIQSHKIVYSVARSIPADYELLEQGILYSTSSIFATMDEKTLDYNFRFDIADETGWALKPNVKAYIGSHLDAVNVLTVRFDRTGKEDTNIYLRGYVIYKSKDAGSKPQIIYTNVNVEKFNENEGDE